MWHVCECGMCVSVACVFVWHVCEACVCGMCVSVACV